MKASFLSRDDFQKWFAAELKRIGVEVEIFEVDPSELLEQPSQRKTLRENPSALNRGMNVMGRVRGKTKGKGGVLVFGHADKPPESYEWGKKHPDLIEKGSRLQGPGIADDVAGLTSLLGAMETYKQFKLEPEGDLLVASILGKQLGVFGTYGLVRRFGPVAGAIYMHPAESGNGLGDIKVAMPFNMPVEYYLLTVTIGIMVSLFLYLFVLTITKKSNISLLSLLFYALLGVSILNRTHVIVQELDRLGFFIALFIIFKRINTNSISMTIILFISIMLSIVSHPFRFGNIFIYDYNYCSI